MTTPSRTLDCDGVADALAQYLEADAPDSVRVAVESHASWCTACQQLLADMDHLRTDAAALPALAPSRDLWQGIAERIDAPIIPLAASRVIDVAPRRRWMRPLLAAAALVAVTAGLTTVITRATFAPAATSLASSVTIAPVPGPAEATGVFTSTVTERSAGPRPASPGDAGSLSARLASAEPLMHEAEPVFASEISKLRKIVRERQSQLDPKTIAVLEQSIAVIDSAIAQSRAALLKDPASGFLASQLNHSLEMKVELLKTAAQLPSRI